jgi:hypothetical protein
LYSGGFRKPKSLILVSRSGFDWWTGWFQDFVFLVQGTPGLILADGTPVRNSFVPIRYGLLALHFQVWCILEWTAGE